MLVTSSLCCCISEHGVENLCAAGSTVTIATPLPRKCKSSRHFHLDCLQPKQVQSNSLVPAQTNCQLFLQTHLCCSILCWVWRSVPDPLHSCLQNRQVCAQAADLQVAVKNKTTYHQEPSLFFVAPGVILLTRMNQFSHGFVWQSPNV